MAKKSKCAFGVIVLFVALILSGNLYANGKKKPVCETLEECQAIRAYLYGEILKQQSEVLRKYLQSQIEEVEDRINKLLECDVDDQERHTITGAVFTCDRTQIYLGDAWRDPSGLIWGDIARNVKGEAQYMKHAVATDYCVSIGARLPTMEEFTQLREYMGWGTPQGYVPQALPNLSNYGFWSSPHSGDSAYFFDGSGGDIGNDLRKFNYAVRCVIRRIDDR